MPRSPATLGVVAIASNAVNVGFNQWFLTRSCTGAPSRAPVRNETGMRPAVCDFVVGLLYVIDTQPVIVCEYRLLFWAPQKNLWVVSGSGRYPMA